MTAIMGTYLKTMVLILGIYCITKSEGGYICYRIMAI